MHEYPEYFVGWGTLSLLNAGLAQSKGRSGLLWWLVSLFIGPVATLLIVVSVLLLTTVELLRRRVTPKPIAAR